MQQANSENLQTESNVTLFPKAYMVTYLSSNSYTHTDSLSKRKAHSYLISTLHIPLWASLDEAPFTLLEAVAGYFPELRPMQVYYRMSNGAKHELYLVLYAFMNANKDE